MDGQYTHNHLQCVAFTKTQLSESAPQHSDWQPHDEAHRCILTFLTL